MGGPDVVLVVLQQPPPLLGSWRTIYAVLVIELLVGGLALVLMAGVQQSARTNTVMVGIKLAILRELRKDFPETGAVSELWEEARSRLPRPREDRPGQPVYVRTYTFMGGRAMVKFQATQAALDRVRRML